MEAAQRSDAVILGGFLTLKPLDREKYMVHEEVVRLLNTAKADKHKSGYGYYLLFRFIAESGARLNAALGVRVVDLVNGPGRAPRARVQWLKKRGGPAKQDLEITEELFRKLKRETRGRRPERKVWTIGDRAVRLAFTKYCDRAGLNSAYSPKALRHYHLLTWYRSSGKNMKLTQERAGHTSIVTTAIYVHTDPEEVEKALNAMPKLP